MSHQANVRTSYVDAFFSFQKYSSTHKGSCSEPNNVRAQQEFQGHYGDDDDDITFQGFMQMNAPSLGGSITNDGDDDDGDNVQVI